MKKEDKETQPGEIKRKGKKKWRRWLLVLLSVAVLCYLFRGWILTTVAGFLIVEQPPQASEYVLLLGADKSFDLAAESFRENSTCRIVVLDYPPPRLQRMGICPGDADVAKKELAKRGVPAANIVVIGCEDRSTGALARALEKWLGEHPDGSVTLLCNRFSTREKSHLLWWHLPEEANDRILFRAVPHRWYDETNWWKSREGMVAFFDGYIGYGFLLFGGDQEEGSEWDPDQYERTLPKSPGGSAAGEDTCRSSFCWRLS
jgi:hypothetical protein